MNLNGQGLFVSALAGLNNTYSAFASQSGSNGTISLEDLTNPSDEVQAKLGTNNNNFLQYLTNNFSDLDSDGDGKINANDMSKLTDNMQKQGLTYNEIVQLCASGNSGMSSTLMDTVLNYFDKIDANGDGRVTSQEITAYGYEADRHKMEQEYGGFKPSNMSVYYGSESDANYKPTSVLDGMYPTENS